jgi:AcrR family transcriptional regulator
MPPKRPRGRPDEGAREKLVQAAMTLFIEHDYEDVSTQDILRSAGVSRGALYHHFPGKLDLFEAVYERGESELVGGLASLMGEATGPFDALTRATHAYLVLCETSPYLRRIGLGQSQRVFGWERWRRAAMRHGLGLVIAMVGAAMDAGELTPRDPELTGQIILAPLIEGALLVLAADDPAAVRAEVEDLITALLRGLRPAA